MLNKKSKIWFYIMGVVFLLVLSAIIYVFVLHFKTKPAFENISGFIMLSLLVSSIVCLSGYFGAKYFAISAFVFNIIGLIYMIIVAKQDSQAFLHSLASLISYFFVFVPGFLISVIIEFIARKLAKKNKKL